MEVFPQLWQNQFGFKVEYDKLPEKIPKHLTLRAGTGLVEPRINFYCIWESPAILIANIIILPVLRYSCGLWRPSTPQGSSSFPACSSSPYKPITCCRCQDMRTQLVPRQGKSRGPQAEIKPPLQGCSFVIIDEHIHLHEQSHTCLLEESFNTTNQVVIYDWNVKIHARHFGTL